jgi:hypothetical protein
MFAMDSSSADFQEIQLPFAAFKASETTKR